MRLEDAENLARKLMDDHDISGTWSFAFDNAKTRCGAAKFRTRTITLSRHYVALNSAAHVRDTILHEIAHVLAGAKAAHGPRWKTIAYMIGARPQRCASGVMMPQGNVEGVCADDCTQRHNRHRMPPKHLLNAYQCTRCGDKVTWVIVK